MTGLAQARETDRPVLILFQEVPGCSTCQNYGISVLSHPLIVEAIEDLFVPVAIFNNRGGTDQAALKRFGEASWNNPVVFAMACFWSGESRLGSLEGVVETRPGFLHGEEVVEVRYDPRVISFPELVKTAQQQHCARKVFSRNSTHQKAALGLVGPRAIRSDEAIRLDGQPKYYLANTSFRHVPMSPMQATRVNGAIGTRQDPMELLSPRQREMLHLVERHPRAGWPKLVGRVPLADAWADVQRVVERIPSPS